MRSKKRVLKNKKFLIAICILILILLGTLIYFCTKNKKIETSAQPMEEREFKEENTNEENIHVGQLQKALESISPNVGSIEDGTKEAEAQLTDKEEAQELQNYEENK